MRKLLNTLYITTPDNYLSLDGETVLIRKNEETVARLPLHNLEAIVTCGYTGMSPALMGACAERNICVTFLTQNNRFLARIIGESRGNVTLRKEQYRISDDEDRSCCIARNFIIGKIYNAKWIIERAKRDYSMRLDSEKLGTVSISLTELLVNVRNCLNLDQLRGFEGNAANVYFSVFNMLILQQNDEFYFNGRNKRPPTDNVNALLSFVYTLLANDCASAIETVGLDAYVGFLHRDRPGRISLALDLMEELRGVMADRFVLSLINKKIVNGKGFNTQEDGAVLMDDETRKTVLGAWQTRKKEEIMHPFLEEKIEWGIVPYVQALLLARFIRGDLNEYPPFMWK